MKNIFLVLLACFCSLVIPLFSAERNHYPLGFNGINAGIRPIDTQVLVNFENFYHANRLVGPNGKNLPFKGHLNELIMLNVYHWYTDIPLLGGTYGFSIFSPMIGLKIKFKSPDAVIEGGSNAFLFADQHFEPINIAYRYDYLHVYCAYGFYIPSGKFKPFSPSNIGLGCWGHQLTYAATYFFDQKKTFSASFYGTYEMHSKLRGIRFYPGDNLCIDWGVGKIFKEVLTVGAAGYVEWQTTKDTGRDVPPGTGGGTDRVYAIGPEIRVDIPKLGEYFNLKLAGILRFRYEVEYHVRNRTKGNAAIGLIAVAY